MIYLVGVALLGHSLGLAVFEGHGIAVPAGESGCVGVSVGRGLVGSGGRVLRSSRVSGRGGISGGGRVGRLIFASLSPLVEAGALYSVFGGVIGGAFGRRNLKSKCFLFGRQNLYLIELSLPIICEISVYSIIIKSLSRFEWTGVREH